MLKINNIKIPISSQKTLREMIYDILGIKKKEKLKFTVLKKSLDARNKNNIHYLYSVDVDTPYLDKYKENKNILISKKKKYDFFDKLDLTDINSKSKDESIVIVGSGPAGLFCGLLLAEAGLKPIIIEQGKSVAKRTKDINDFWNKGVLNTQSNVVFGEGGAGTFSDGKLSSQISDKFNRFNKFFTELIKAGAPKEIAYSNKPHIGTDKLRLIIPELRNKIIFLGGEVRFESKLTDIKIKNNKIESIFINEIEEIKTNKLVLAIGHSARDTFNLLNEKGIKIDAKSFSVGLRIEHPQELINKIQYGYQYKNPLLPPADYKLVQHLPQNRSLYSFCMCPGGEVIASSSEKETIVTNGMSFSQRDGKNANSALLVSVSKDDFGSDPLAGIDFQQKLEKQAFNKDKPYFAPAQRLDDFMKNKKTDHFDKFIPTYKPGVYFANFNNLLPKYVVSSIKEGLRLLNNKYHGILYPDAVLTGVETRSSSPIKIVRNENLQSINTEGLYPCGEGSGYAGGITSSAVDGLKVAESIINSYQKLN